MISFCSDRVIYNDRPYLSDPEKLAALLAKTIHDRFLFRPFCLQRSSCSFRSREAGCPAVQDHPRSSRPYLPAHPGADPGALVAGRRPAEAVSLQEHGEKEPAAFKKNFMLNVKNFKDNFTRCLALVFLLLFVPKDLIK